MSQKTNKQTQIQILLEKSALFSVNFGQPFNCLCLTFDQFNCLWDLICPLMAFVKFTASTVPELHCITFLHFLKLN